MELDELFDLSGRIIRLILIIITIGSIPVGVNAASKWTDLGSGWKIRLDPPHDNGKNGKWHVHVENKNGSIKSAENVDGTKHDNKTLDNLPKKVKDKARGSKTYKKGKENQKKTNAAKVEIKRRGLHWNNAFQAVAIIAILVLFGIACYFTGGAAALIFA